MRELKTTPVSVLLYAASKTKNQLTQQQKDLAASGGGAGYDKQEDLYRNMYEQVSMNFRPDREMVKSVEAVQAGKGPDKDEGSGFSADGQFALLPFSGSSPLLLLSPLLMLVTLAAHSALILALETYGAADKKVRGASWTRIVYLMTDGESETDWDSWERTADRYAEKGISVVVV